MFLGKKFQFFLKYLFSYVIVLLLPLVTMGVFVQNFLIDTLKHEIVVINNLNNLNRVKYVLDQQVLQLQNTSTQLMYVNSNLKPFYQLNQDPLKAWKIMNELQKYTTTNHFIHEMMVYFRGEDRLYSNRSVYTLSMLSDHIYPYPNWSKEEIYHDLNRLTEPLIRPAEMLQDEGKFITFLYPILPSSSTPYAAVIFIVKEEAVHRILEDEFKSYDGNTFILNQNNEVITSLDSSGSGLPEQVAAGLPNDFEPFTQTIKWNGETYYSLSVKSKESGWTYVSTLPVSQVLAKVTTVQTWFVLGIIAILTLGAMVIYGSMNMNYKPLSQLKRYTESIWKHAEPMNELDTVRLTIDSLFTQNRALNVKVESSREAAEDYLLDQLLKGRNPDAEAFNEAGREWGIVFTKPKIRVAILHFHGESASVPSEERRLLLKSLGQGLPKSYEGYGRDHLDENKWVMVLACDADEGADPSDELSVFHQYVRNLLQQGITIGVGSAVADWREVPKSYFEAATAIDYRFIKGKEQVIFSKDIIIDQQTLEAYPHQEIAELRSAIKQGNLNKIEKLLQQLQQYLKENNMPLFIARGLCFDLINVVIQTMGEISSQGLPSGIHEYPDVFLLEKYETVEEFTSLVKQICRDISVHLDRLAGEDNLDLDMRMMLYVKQNYANRNFSVQEMADYFKMAPPNLSHFFKDRTGQTVLDFATQLRIDKAKQLLLSSTLPVKSIAEQTGFDNVSSFIRRFKQWTGITPGDFRNRGEVI
ncbi:helix-turn-helix domain-containing protein [Paenibacillus sp. J2TS4]|uniref:helix-turn-helix domain-containing protein n=1 Tax=Paenibacillus sp. J2TS4 TaxID=2807194 RepID=UPI001B1C07F0|nr:helix-turn-helix domain-containing protein [Paenibacillus sp. J2TS4]GIP34887.1 hypothetical protein J2TS4_40970 [Paenibacillus sp. J2TS4]